MQYGNGFAAGYSYGDAYSSRGYSVAEAPYRGARMEEEAARLRDVARGKEEELRVARGELSGVQRELQAMERYRAHLLTRLRASAASSSSTSSSAAASAPVPAPVGGDAFSSTERREVLRRSVRWNRDNGRLEITLLLAKGEVVPKLQWEESRSLLSQVDTRNEGGLPHLRHIIIRFGLELVTCHIQKQRTGRAVAATLNGLERFRFFPVTISILNTAEQRVLFSHDFWQRMFNLVQASVVKSHVWPNLRALEFDGLCLHKVQAGRLIGGFYHDQRELHAAAPSILQKLPNLVFRGAADDEGAKKILHELLPFEAGTVLKARRLSLQGLNWSKASDAAIARFFERLGGVERLELVGSRMRSLVAVRRGLQALHGRGGQSSLRAIDLRNHMFRQSQVCTELPGIVAACPLLERIDLRSGSLGDTQALRARLPREITDQVVVQL